MGDDAIGVADFLLNDFDLFGDARFAFLESALQGEGGIVDDSERIFDLMDEFGGHASSRAQLAFAQGKFARLFLRLALPFH